MPRPANPKRDTAILAFWLRGWTYQRIADRYGLSMARVNQIIAEQREIPRKRAA
jgi:DNA-directed RNA polymerase specialized sigma24 family protein